jgi:hypothetical protein
MAKRISGELPGYAASAQCAASHLVEALDKTNYPHMGLIALFNSRRISLFEQRDRNEIDQADTAREQSRLIREFIATEHAAEQDRLSLRAIGLGTSRTVPGRDPLCISNNLRPECAYDRKRSEATTVQNYADPSKGPFFLDWSPATRRCFVVSEKPSDHSITGGGPFQTFDEAFAATLSVHGCQPTSR